MENQGKLSRRRMLQLTGVSMLGVGAMFAGAGCASDGGKGSAAGEGAENSGKITLSVYDPSGNIEVTQEFAQRLDSLDGKTIAFLGNGMWEEDRTFDELEKLVAEAFPNTTIITPDNFPRHSDDLTKEDNGIADMMKEFNVDGVIVGNAG